MGVEVRNSDAQARRIVVVKLQERLYRASIICSDSGDVGRSAEL